MLIHVVKKAAPGGTSAISSMLVARLLASPCVATTLIAMQFNVYQTIECLLCIDKESNYLRHLCGDKWFKIRKCFISSTEWPHIKGWHFSHRGQGHRWRFILHLNIFRHVIYYVRCSSYFLSSVRIATCCIKWLLIFTLEKPWISSKCEATISHYPI